VPLAAVLKGFEGLCFVAWHLPGFNGYDVTACATMGANSIQQISHYSPQEWSNHIAGMVEAAVPLSGHHLRPPKKRGAEAPQSEATEAFP
jgi:hypothetical protein